MTILPVTYIGNIQYFTKLCFDECIIDIHENFVKQSYRTRCDIMAANGVASMSLQTVKPSGTNKCSVADMRIDYSKRWQHTHWQSIVSAYRSSPYFAHYEEFFAPFFHHRYNFLIDLNLPLMEVALKLTGIPANITLSSSYIKPSPGDSDFREALSPKARLHRADPKFVPAPYYQVFSEKYPFAANLSIIDLLFCEGPNSLAVIRDSHKG